MYITVAIMMLFTSTFSVPLSDAENTHEVNTQELPKTEKYVREYFADNPILIDIAWCESKFKQYEEDGEVHRGEVNRSDVGVMQINEYYHGDTAEWFNIDLYTLEGNVTYAKYLFEKEGTQPWSSSSHCWSTSSHIAQL